MKKGEMEHQEIIHQDSFTKNYWHVVAGLYSAGNIFTLFKKNHSFEFKCVSHSYRQPSKTKTIFTNHAELSFFVEQINGYVYGHKLLEFKDFCKTLEKTLIIVPNQVPTDAWLFGFSRQKVTFWTNSKTGKTQAFIQDADITILGFFVDRFGGVIQKRNGDHVRWALYDQKRLMSFCTFLLMYRESWPLLPLERQKFREAYANSVKHYEERVRR